MSVEQIVEKASKQGLAAQATLRTQETSKVNFENDRLKSAESLPTHRDPAAGDHGWQGGHFLHHRSRRCGWGGEAGIWKPPSSAARRIMSCRRPTAARR